MNAITKGYQDVPMTRRRAQLLAEYADKLAEMLENAPDDQDLAEWVQSKIDRAAGAIQSAYHYLDQEDDEDLEKAVGHKYTHRKRVGTDKRGRARYRYYYAEHQGGGITRASFEAGSAFKLTYKGRRGHFHIHHVEGDQVFITHDSRPDMEPVAISKSELRALLKRQHTKAEQAHVEKRRKEVERIKSRNVKRGLGLALHRLRQAATQAGVELDERYQRKPKKKKTPAQVTDTPREDRFDTMPEVEAPKSATLINETNFPTLPPDRRGAGFMTYGGETFREIPSIDGALFSFTPGTLDRWLRGKDAQSILEGIYRKTAEIAKQADPTADIEEEYESLVEYAEKNARRIFQSPFTDEAKKMSFALKDLQDALEKDKYKKDEPPLTILNEILATLNDLSSQAPTPRNELTETAQQIIEEANQDHEERHDEHQEITKFELGEHTHTKTGAKLFTAKQTERVDRDEYFRRVEIAKKHRGRYERRYVKGFVFKNAEDARNFALEVEGAAQEAPETSAETVTPHEDHPSADNFETMPEVESAPKSSAREQLIETAEQATAPSSPLNIDQANAQDTLTETRTRNPESKAADKALIESARELAKTSERGEEIKSAVLDLMNAQQLKRYKRATGDMSARAEDMIEKRREARERLRSATSGEVINNFETMPETEAQPKRRVKTRQEVREAQEARLVQQKTFTSEIQSAIDVIKNPFREGITRSFESHFKTRKDGGIYRMAKGDHEGNLAYAITTSLPEEITEYEIGMDGLRSLIVDQMAKAIEQRETPAELKDRIGAVITQRAQDNAVRRKEEIVGRAQGAAIREMRHNITTLTGRSHLNSKLRGEREDRSYIGLESIEDQLSIKKRIDETLIGHRFRQALPPEVKEHVAPTARYGYTRAADHVTTAFANKYETVGEIRDNISTIREQMRSTIKGATSDLTEYLVQKPAALNMIKRSYEKATEQRNPQRQKALKAARALAQYTEDPQAHLAEIQELERQSEQAIAEQMEINREFARAYIHEASDLVERALETTKGEVVDNIMNIRGLNMHEGTLIASVQGRANRKLMARIFNEVFEQVRREIEDEPIERGENHPRNIADTVKKPSTTPAQFRDDIERIVEEKKARRRAEREAKRSKSADNFETMPEGKTSEETPTTNTHAHLTRKITDAALSPRTSNYKRGDRARLPTKGDLQNLLSEEERRRRAADDLRGIDAPGLTGKRDARSDIMYALQGYISGVLSELNQNSLKNLEDSYFKPSLRDAKGEDLEQTKSEIARFWREWGGEYKRLHGELVAERTQGEALRNIRPLIPERALTPELNQLLDQMERELDQKPISDLEPFYAIDTAESNLATKPAQPQPTTPREQLTETAREVTQGADNFETMPETEEAPSPTPRAPREALSETVERTSRRGRRSERFVDVGAHVWGSRADKASLNRASLDTMNPKELAKASGRDKVVTWQGLGQELQDGEEKGHTPSAVILKEAIIKLLPARPFKYQTALTDADGNAVETEKVGDFIDGCDFLMQSLDRCQTMSDIAEFMTEFSFLKDGHEVDIFSSREEAQAFLDTEHAGQGKVKYAGAIIERGESRSIYHAMREVDPSKASEFQKMFIALSGVTQNMPRNKQRRRPLAKVLNNAPEIEDMVKGKLTPFVYGLDIPKPFLDAVKKALALKGKGYDSPEVKEMMTQAGVSKPKTPRKKRKQAYKFIRNVGEAARRGGTDTGRATSQTLKDSLNLTNVQYGNWMDEKSREVHTQHCQDAFSDLADILGVDAKDLSLSGRLSIGFGARGKGKANAHYEPSAKIINLTKFAGGGSLAHEWGHFLDNIIAETINVKPSAETQVMISDAFTVNGLWNGIESAQQGEVREALVDATTEVMRAILYEPLERVTQEQVEQAREEQRRHRAKISDLVLQYNTRKMPEERRRGFKEEYKELVAEQNSLKTKVSNLHHMHMETPRGNALRNTNPSQYFIDSDALNNGKNGYWTRPHEMFARAFESYIEDELASQGRINSYLVSGTRDQYDTSSHKGAQPYPQGEQRKKINKAMKAFIDLVREEGWLQKALRNMSLKRGARINYRAQLLQTIERIA